MCGAAQPTFGAPQKAAAALEIAEANALVFTFSEASVEPAIVAHAYNPNIQEAIEESKIETSLGPIARLCLKKTNRASMVAHTFNPQIWETEPSRSI